MRFTAGRGSSGSRREVEHNDCHVWGCHEDKDKELLDRITIDPNIRYGRPTIRGHRYTVEMVLELLSSGMTAEEILEDYEDLEKNDILAALAYAARVARVKRIEPEAA